MSSIAPRASGDHSVEVGTGIVDRLRVFGRKEGKAGEAVELINARASHRMPEACRNDSDPSEQTPP